MSFNIKLLIVLTFLMPFLVLSGPVKRDVITIYQTHTYTVWSTVYATMPHLTAESSSTAAAQVQHTTTPATITRSKASTSIVSSSASSSTSTQWDAAIDYSKLSTYAAPILKQHNIHRENHTAPPLNWDDELADWAKQLADTCVYEHSRVAGDSWYGQNIGAGAAPEDVSALITNGMYNGEIMIYPGYNGEPEMSRFHDWGHFSQIVWMNTTSVGCHTTTCGFLQNVGDHVAPHFTVCNYRPPGNYGGEFHKNVVKPLGMKSVVIQS